MTGDGSGMEEGTRRVVLDLREAIEAAARPIPDMKTEIASCGSTSSATCRSSTPSSRAAGAAPATRRPGSTRVSGPAWRWRRRAAPPGARRAPGALLCATARRPGVRGRRRRRGRGGGRAGRHGIEARTSRPWWVSTRSTGWWWRLRGHHEPTSGGARRRSPRAVREAVDAPDAANRGAPEGESAARGSCSSNASGPTRSAFRELHPAAAAPVRTSRCGCLRDGAATCCGLISHPLSLLQALVPGRRAAGLCSRRPTGRGNGGLVPSPDSGRGLRAAGDVLSSRGPRFG